MTELKHNGKLQEKLSHETINKLDSMKTSEKGKVLQSAGLISSSPEQLALLMKQLTMD